MTDPDIIDDLYEQFTTAYRRMADDCRYRAAIDESFHPIGPDDLDLPAEADRWARHWLTGYEDTQDEARGGYPDFRDRAIVAVIYQAIDALCSMQPWVAQDLLALAHNLIGEQHPTPGAFTRQCHIAPRIEQCSCTALKEKSSTTGTEATA